MEQIITRKPIIIIPEKTKKQTLKRGLSTLEELKNEGIQKQRVVEKHQKHSTSIQEKELVEKRVKLSTRNSTTSKSKVINNKNTLSADNDVAESVLDINGTNNCCFSLLSSCASLQENCVIHKALSQMSTSYSNLDDDSLSESGSKLQLSITPSNKLNDECISSHFLSQKALSDDEIEEEDDAKSSRDNPIPNLTSQSQTDISCPIQGQGLSSTWEQTQNQTIGQFQAEETETSDVKKVTIINSASFMDREHTSKWSYDETLKFYKGLELFGTDFSMISRLFTNRTRKMCKNKFRKEEKLNMKEIEKRLFLNRSLRMKKVVQRLNSLRAKLNLKFAKSTEERIQLIQKARRSRFGSFNSIDSLDINVIETIESQLNGIPLF